MSGAGFVCTLYSTSHAENTNYIAANGTLETDLFWPSQLYSTVQEDGSVRVEGGGVHLRSQRGVAPLNAPLGVTVGNEIRGPMARSHEHRSLQ
jgi:hypothetical protein